MIKPMTKTTWIKDKDGHHLGMIIHATGDGPSLSDMAEIHKELEEREYRKIEANETNPYRGRPNRR